jgi:EAL domain-containing protein (putative c-di-GMP-specific phosphodiesterase class I)
MHDSIGVRIVPRPTRHPCDRVPSMAKDTSGLAADLRDAIRRNELSVDYQPQFDLCTGRGCGVEALARWMLSTGVSIAPSVFIPLAERTGLIHQLGAWVLQSACESVKVLCVSQAPQMILSVNVSALQINERFCGVVERCLKQSGFPAQQLELEITESAFIGDTEMTIAYLERWKVLGVRIAVDDFGSGYSSLGYLARLPVDRLKLDQSLIRRMAIDARSAIVMRSILSLAAELGLDVIAEGVETELQFQMLADMGCPQAQGYLLGRPMPVNLAQESMRKPWGDRRTPVLEALCTAPGDCHGH